MKRIAILTAGGDTPALNATLFGAVQRACELEVEVFGLIRGFAGVKSPQLPHVLLNPLFSVIPELDPCYGGTIIGASRTYVDSDDKQLMVGVHERFDQLGIEGLICIGGDGTINGMQPLSEHFPCVLAPKTIDNDLGLNHIDEPNEWIKDEAEDGSASYRQEPRPGAIQLSEIVNYVTPGYATAVYVVAQGVNRIRTTAESHRRIAIVEVMGRNSGSIALGAAYGQPDIILIPEHRIDQDSLYARIRQIYDLQKNVVIVIGEGVRDASGQQLGENSSSVDAGGNVLFSGAAGRLAEMLMQEFGDDYFKKHGTHNTAKRAIFHRKVGHTQRGGRPVAFDRFYATQLGGKAVDLITQERNNYLSVLQWTEESGITLGELPANKLRDAWGNIRARAVHSSFYDPASFQPSSLGRDYLNSIFANAIGHEDVESLHAKLFQPGNLSTRYQSINVDIQKRIRYLDS
jgi:ATP-dependent phosphofructokinase / diphosphate-dependent phosphofructokinase